jgi:hypothetical protein
MAYNMTLHTLDMPVMHSLAQQFSSRWHDCVNTCALTYTGGDTLLQQLQLPVWAVQQHGSVLHLAGSTQSARIRSMFKPVECRLGNCWWLT